MKRFGIFLCLIVLTALTVCAMAEDVPLELAILPDSQAVLTKSDFRDRADRKVVIYGGVVLPAQANRVELSQDAPEKKLTLGKVSFTVRMGEKNNLFLKTRKGETLLSTKLYGLESQEIALAKDRKYVLAFPRAFGYMDNEVFFYRSGCVQKGKLGEEQIALYDSNADGFYEKGVDGILMGALGKVNVFAPLSDFLSATSGVYKIEKVARDGSSISFSKHAGELGKIMVEFEGGEKLKCLVAFGSTDGKSNFVVFGRQGEQFVVLAGKYRLLYGLLYSQETSKAVATVMSGEMQPVKVMVGETTKVAIGGISLDTEVKIDVTKTPIEVAIAENIVLRGKAGEQYFAEGIQKFGVEIYKGQERHLQKSDLSKSAETYSFKAQATEGDRKSKPLWGECELRISANVTGIGTLRAVKKISLGVDLTKVKKALKEQKYAEAKGLFDAMEKESKGTPGYEARKEAIGLLGSSIAFELSSEGRLLSKLQSQVEEAVKKEDWKSAKDSLEMLSKKLADSPEEYKRSLAYSIRKKPIGIHDFQIRLNTGDGVPGLLVTYFEDTKFKKKLRSEFVEKVDWVQSPDGKLRKNFSCRYSGALRIGQKGRYELHLESDDGSRLWIDGQLVVVYSQLSLSNGWEKLAFAYDRGYAPRDSLRLGVNIFAYALTH